MECKRCLYNDEHPLGITFNSDGICSGCLIHEEKDSIDWSKKYEKLEELVNNYRQGEYYDCVVPVTSSSDSFFVLHHVINILKLKPLVVHYNKYFNNMLSIRNLAKLREVFGVDIIIKNSNLKIVQDITRYALERYGNPYWHALAGNTVFAVQSATKFNIPLIVWGAHQGIEQVGMFAYDQGVEMTRRYRKDHDLFRKEVVNEDDPFSILNESIFGNYEYPNDNVLYEKKIRGIYLNNFIRWDYRKQAELVVEKYGFETLKSSSTFDIYENVDCYVYLNIHNKLKYLKHGYSKVTDQLCREIRHKRLSREEAAIIEKAYIGKWNEYEDIFCDWLGIKKESLEYICSLHTKHKIKDESLTKSEKKIVDKFESTYIQNPIKETVKEGYIYFGKGV